MQPRLKSSQTWTSIPAEFVGKIRESFEEAFRDQADKGNFIVEGRIYKEEVLMRIGYIQDNTITQRNSEVSLEFDYKKDNINEVIGTAADCAGDLLTDIFEKSKKEVVTEALADLPIEWTAYEVDKKTVHLQYSTVNSNLELMANELLGQLEEVGLVNGDSDDELDTIIEGLGLSDDDTPQPEIVH